MTVETLKREYERNHPQGHFFDRETLRWFGERFSEMRVLKAKALIKDYYGEEHLCYILSSVQRPPWGKPFRKYHYFDVETFDDIIPRED